MPPGTVNPERAAHELLARLITEAAAREMHAPAELTLTLWLEKYVMRANRDKAATIYDRARTVKLISEGLGKLRLDKLTPSWIQDWLDDMTLIKAVALGHLSRNPAAPVKLAKVPFRPKGPPGPPSRPVLS